MQNFKVPSWGPGISAIIAVNRLTDVRTITESLFFLTVGVRAFAPGLRNQDRHPLATLMLELVLAWRLWLLLIPNMTAQRGQRSLQRLRLHRTCSEACRLSVTLGFTSDTWCCLECGQRKGNRFLLQYKLCSQFPLLRGHLYLEISYFRITFFFFIW